MSTNRLIFIFSLIGFAVTAFLAYEYSLTGSIICPITGSGCDAVRKSIYSKLFGINLPYFGLVFYLTVSVLSVLLTQSFNKLINKFRLFVSFSGFVFGAYLTFLEAFIIKAYCIWCLASFVISIGILILCIKSVKIKDVIT